MAVIGFFLVVDVAFFLANAVKIPQGGWFPLLVAAVVFMPDQRQDVDTVLRHT